MPSDQQPMMVEVLEPRILLSGSIAGLVWDDFNGDGVLDGGEPRLHNWTVHVDADGDGVLDGGEVTATTDANGLYSFSNLAAGDYTIRLVVPAGWTATWPDNAGTRMYTLADGQVDNGAWFGAINDGGGGGGGGGGNLLNFDSHNAARYTDADGDIVTVSLRGPGVGQVILPEAGGDALTFQITGSTVDSILKVTANGGLGETSVVDILIDGSAKKLDAKVVDLLGDLSVSGSVVKVILGNVDAQHNIMIGAGVEKGTKFVLDRVVDASISVNGGISVIKVNDWDDTDATLDTILANWVGKVISKEDFDAGFNLSGAGAIIATLRAVKTVGGLRGTSNISGNVGKITAGTNADIDLTVLGQFKGVKTKTGSLTGTLDVTGDTGKLTVQTDADIDLTVGGEFMGLRTKFGGLSGTLRIGGVAGKIIVGTDSDADMNILGLSKGIQTKSGNLAGTLTASVFKKITVAGDVGDAILLAGADLGDDVALGGSGDDADRFGPGLFGSINVGDSVTNSFFAAGLDPTSGTTSGPQSEFGSIRIGGSLDASTLFVTAAFGGSVKANGLSIDPGADDRFQTALALLTANAFNYDGPYPASDLVAYTDDAEVAVQAWAIPGFVDISTLTSATADSITALVESNAGTVVAQIPALGYYVASVTPGTEATFIAAMHADAAVNFAAPHQAVTTASTAVDLSDMTDLPFVPNLNNQVGNGVYLHFIDDFAYTAPGDTEPHGDNVSYVGTQGLFAGPGQNINVAEPDGSIETSDVDAAIVQIAQKLSMDPNGRAVINISLGASEWDDQGTPDPSDDVLLDPDVYRQDAHNDFRQTAQFLSNLADAAPGIFDRMVVVVAADNYGLDMTEEILQLKTDFPNVFPDGASPHMILAGGTMVGSSLTDQDLEHGGIAGDIIYAPGNDVPCDDSGATCTGTSFAAPAIARLLAKVLVDNPGLSVTDATQAFLDAYRLNGYVLPSLELIQGRVGDSATPPSLDLSTLSLDFGSISQGHASSLPFTITNSGPTGSLLIYSIGDDASWLDVSSPIGTTSGTISSGVSLQHHAMVDTSGLAEGLHNARIYVSDPNATNGPFGTISVSMTVTPADGVVPTVPSISISDGGIVEGDDNAVYAFFTVSLSGATTEPVLFQYRTTDATAVAGQDYDAVETQTRIIPAGSTVEVVSVRVPGDYVVEPGVSFFVDLLNPTNATINDGIAVGTITDNDVAGVTVELVDSWTSEDGDTGRFSLSLTSKPADDVTILLVSDDTSEGNILSANPVFTP